MLLYHYSKELFPFLLTRRYSNKLSSKELKDGLEQSTIRCEPAPYYDHISFFFDKVPLKIIGDLFKGKNDFWKNGNKIYEYTIDTDSLSNNLKYFITETPSQVKKLDETEWVDTDEFFREYMKEKRRLAEKNHEIGKGQSELEKQIQKYQGQTEAYYINASKRDDFDDNITKYAASVPHVMLYPEHGKVFYVSKKLVEVGVDNNDPNLSNESLFIKVSKDINKLQKW
jgi:hypothetical protein